VLPYVLLHARPFPFVVDWHFGLLRSTKCNSILSPAIEQIIEKLKVTLQKQPYDHILRDDERQESAFDAVAEYIARNPERRGLIQLIATDSILTPVGLCRGVQTSALGREITGR
jgi:hypothetical protein